MPLRLLFVSHSLPAPDAPLSNIGGMQRVALDLHQAFSARDDLAYRPLVLRASWDHITWKVARFMAASLWRIRRQVRQGDVDVVLFSSMVTAALAVLLRPTLRRHGVKAAAIVHGLDVTTPAPIYQWFVPKVFAALDAVLPVSRATGAACLARGLTPEKLHVVPNGVRLDRFGTPADPAALRAAARQSLADAAPLSDRALLLCSVGRQVKRKGFAWFVETVMPRLPEDVHYWIGGAEGPETEAIHAAIRQGNLGRQVRLLGRLTEQDLESLYRGADLFVMPNISVPGDMEGFGVVMLEAGLCGLPTVAARLEGIQDVITEGANGHYVESGDVDGFVRAILRYHHDAGAQAEAATRARRHTVDTFGWPAVAGQYVQVLQAVADGDTAQG